MRSKTLFVLFTCLAVVLVATSSRQDLTASPQQASAQTVAEYVQLMDSYCAACHSGGLAGQTSLVPVPQFMDEVETDLTNIGAEAEIWETVLRKLGGRMMPPPGMPAPADADLEAFTAFLADELNSAAACQSESWNEGAASYQQSRVRQRSPRPAGFADRRGGVFAS